MRYGGGAPGSKTFVHCPQQRRANKGNQRNILFLCNGKVKGCKKENCYKHGGECRHTSNVEYAVNFQKCGQIFREKLDAEK